MEPIPAAKHLSIASVQSSSGFSSVGSSVEGLFTKEEGNSNENSNNKSFKFNEILSIINLETDDKPIDGNNTSSVREPQSELELFESKVSKWQKYGFTEEPSRDVVAKLELFNRTLPCDSANSEQSELKSLDNRGTRSKIFSSLIQKKNHLSSAIIALQLEVCVDELNFLLKFKMFKFSYFLQNILRRPSFKSSAGGRRRSTL